VQPGDTAEDYNHGADDESFQIWVVSTVGSPSHQHWISDETEFYRVASSTTQSTGLDTGNGKINLFSTASGGSPANGYVGCLAAFEMSADGAGYRAQAINAMICEIMAYYGFFS